MICVVNKEIRLYEDSRSIISYRLKVGDKLYMDTESMVPTINMIHYQGEFEGKVSWNWNNKKMVYPRFKLDDGRIYLLDTLLQNGTLSDITTQEFREVTLKSILG